MDAFFLQNSGGSHHFAGAAFIADKNNVSIRLTTTLNFIELNEPAVEWLLDEFEIYVAPRKESAMLVKLAATIAGQCYAWDIPDVICRDATFILLPRRANASDIVSEALARSGLETGAGWLASLLCDQRANRAILAEGFPQIFAPGSEPGAIGSTARTAEAPA